MRRADMMKEQMELEFKEMDRMYANGEFRIYGRDTNRLFKEIDIIRRKQIELASDHVHLETLDDLSPHFSGDMEEDYKRNMAYFNRKKIEIENLRDKLDTLGQIMHEFYSKTESNPHIGDATQEESDSEPITLTHPQEYFAALQALREDRISQSSSPSTTDIPETDPSSPRESISVDSVDQSTIIED
ncbi:hypothetical protein [Parasitella parasitica]|uniref:Uncharacterized protein n=1 Tax=Parasitella parasitica TaxID=35722 RepID=A0A0B7NCU5_9FUNG|nr:hypothetical protein [Parasitella parasitica]